MSDEAFIDSGAFIAFLDRSDRLHEDARALFATPPPRLYTSLLVSAETQGWFLHRLGEEAARAFMTLLHELRPLALLGVDAQHHEAVLAKLDRLRGSKLSYVDASSLVFLDELRIAAVWGTDHHLGLEGAHVSPGSGVA